MYYVQLSDAIDVLVKYLRMSSEKDSSEVSLALITLKRAYMLTVRRCSKVAFK